MPPLPFQNQTLGVSPETLNPFWEQFQLSGMPNGNANMGIGEMAVVFALTSAQLLALNATAVQIVAAPVTAGLPSYLVPPNGYLFVPNTLTAEYKFGGTAYTIGNADNNFQIEYTGKATALLSMTVTGLVDQAVNTMATNDIPVVGSKISLANSANLGLEVKLVGTTPALTLGNGTVVLYLTYDLMALI